MLKITETPEKTVLQYEKEGECLLRLEEQSEGAQIDIAVSGKLRSELAEPFFDELLPMALLGCDLRVDLSGLHYLSAACQGVFLHLQQKMDAVEKGSLRIVGLSPAILKEFELTGATELLQIEEG